MMRRGNKTHTREGRATKLARGRVQDDDGFFRLCARFFLTEGFTARREKLSAVVKSPRDTTGLRP